MVMTDPKDNHGKLYDNPDGTGLGQTGDENQIVCNFFGQYSDIKVADDGFTARVMHSLPDEQPMWRLNRLWTAACAVVGIAMFWWLDGLSVLKTVLINVFGNLVGLTANAVTSVDWVATAYVVGGLVIAAVVSLVDGNGEERLV